MVVIIFLLIAAFGYVLQSRIYSSSCFKNVFVDVAFSDEGVFEGDRTQFTETVGNRKWLFLWWLIIRFKISNKIKFDRNEDTGEATGSDRYRRDLFSLGSYQKAVRRYNVTASKRGYYKVDNMTMTSGDLFARYKYLIDLPLSADLYVYPSPVNTGEFSIPFERMMGEVLTRRNLIEDPFQIRGVRDYAPFDSFKKINWNATARSAGLKVNEYDFTSSREIILLLNVERFNEWDGDGTIEESIRIASSMAGESIGGGIPAGLISNGLSSITGERIEIHPSNSPGYAGLFLRELACLDSWKVSEPFADTLKEVSLKGNTQPLYVLISQYFGEDLQGEVERMRSDGYSIYWILPKNKDTALKVRDRENLYVWDVMVR